MGKTKSSTKSAKPRQSASAAKLHTRPARSTRLMQDIVKPAKAAHLAAKIAPKAKPLVVSKAISPKVRARTLDTSFKPAIRHHPAESSKTLMRAYVTKPKPGLKRSYHVQTPTDISVKQPSIPIIYKHAASAIDPVKARRAVHIKKSNLIQRFAPEKPTWYSGHEHAAILTPQQSASPVISAAAAPKSMDVFQRAMEHAASNEQAKTDHVKTLQHRSAAKPKAHKSKPVHHRLPSVVAASLAVLLLAGFVTWQNKTAITLRFATAKAGFHATLPQYRPSGFAVGKFHYSAGNVAVNYTSGATGRSYNVSEQTSDMNSQALLQTAVIPHNRSYQTLQTGGRTIYIYGDNNAAWVDGGVLYKITSNGNLSTSDILAIARSV